MNVIRRLLNNPEDDEGATPTPDNMYHDDPSLPHEGPVGIGIEGSTRQLPKDDTPDLVSAHLIFAQASDIGAVRHNNQDAAMSFFATLSSSENRPDFGVFVIADGMGGHTNGEIASAVAARTVTAELIQRVYTPMLTDSDDDRPPISEALNEAIVRANNAVMQQAPEGGTTLTAVVVMGDLAYIGHVGDSRAYIVDQGVAEQITRDHSYVQRLFELGQLAQEEASSHPQKNVLYRALGQTDIQEVDLLTRRLPSNAYLIICSDGLWGQVRDHEIVRILHDNPEPQAACAALVAQANRAGGIDNVSVIVIRIPQ